MKSLQEFPFNKARRITAKEVNEARKAIEEKTGEKRSPRGRPAKKVIEKFVATSIRLDPRGLAWAKREAKKRNVGYQTVINELLLKKAVS